MKVKELLSDESKWTKGVYAKDKSGGGVYPNDEDAICWCLSGAIEKCYNPHAMNPGYYISGNRYAQDIKNEKKIVKMIFKAIKKGTYQFPSIGEWNDAPERTFKDIRDLVEKLDI